MESLQDLVRSLNLRHSLLELVTKSHKLLLRLSGGAIDMDKVQKYVFDSLPDFTLQTSVVAVVLAFIFWMAVYYLQYRFIAGPFFKALR